MYPVCNCVKLVLDLWGTFIMNLHIPSVHVGTEESSAVGNPQILRKLLKVATDCHPHFQRQYYAVWEVGLLFVQLEINMCSKYNFFYIFHIILRLQRNMQCTSHLFKFEEPAWGCRENLYVRKGQGSAKNVGKDVWFWYIRTGGLKEFRNEGSDNFPVSLL